MMRNSRFTLRVVAVAAVLSLVGCDAVRQQSARVEVGQPLPAYAARALDGDTLSLADLRGHPVLFNLWATWCQPCRAEMPGLEALYEDFGSSGLRIVGVSIDRAGADDAVRDFLDQYGIRFTILRDPDQRVTRIFRTTGVPESFLIDADGILVKRWIGQMNARSAEVREVVQRAVTGGMAADSAGIG